MTYSPKTELVGGLNPYVKSENSIGGVFADLGTITSEPILCAVYCGNGIVLVGDHAAHIWRSTDYGSTWTDIGIIGGFRITSLTYLGTGICLCITNSVDIYRSTDFGVNWTSVVGNPVFAHSALADTLAYLGYNGIVLVGDTFGDIYTSSDYGLTWSNVIGNPVAGAAIGITSITHLDISGISGITIFTTNNGHIWRSTNFGLTWTDIDNIPGVSIGSSLYIGRGVAFIGASNGHVWRSENYGLTWADIGDVTGSGLTINTLEYLGNGIILAGCINGVMALSKNYGKTGSWSNNSVSLNHINKIRYLTNGITIVCDNATGAHIFRNDVAFKLDEAESLIDPSIITITSDITLGQSHNMVNVDTSGGSVTITLPVPSTLQKGHEFIIKNIAVSQNIVIITPGATTIDGFTTARILSDLEQSLKIRTDGVRYFINSEYQNFTLGQLKPPITRWTMPGWLMTRGDTDFGLVAEVIYYIPFFVASTTGFLKFSVDVTVTGAGTLGVQVFSWNDGIPGSLINAIGNISVAAPAGQKTQDLPPLILHRGLYFMAVRATVGIKLRSGNFGQAVSSPVGAMTNTNNPSTTNYLNQFITFVNSVFTDPAPVPTDMQTDFPIFLLQEHA